MLHIGLLVTIPLSVTPLPGEDHQTSELVSDATRLSEAGVAPTQQGAIDFLNRLRPSNASKRRIAELIVKLGDRNYITREKACKSLGRFGSQAETQLIAALDNRDLEVAMQAKKLLQTITDNRDFGKHDALLSASLRMLALRRHPDSVDTILRTIPLLTSQDQIDQACVALWFAVENDDAERIAQGLLHESLTVRAASIPAMELATGDSSIPKILPFLSDPAAPVRLAAARALIDRSPERCADALGKLLDAKDTRIKLRAAWLLHCLLDEPSDEEIGTQFSEKCEFWKEQIAAKTISRWRLPLQQQRLQLNEFGSIFLEEFERSIALIHKQYGELQYESTVARAQASTKQGILRLHGDHDEGDQRMILKAKQIIGNERFTKPFQVTTEIGGEAKGYGGYHVGISIGNLRLLFHPGYRGGGFRIERVDNHRYIVTNQEMPFTPTAGVLHKMRVHVTPQKDGRVQLKTTIADPKNPKQKYVKQFLAESTDIGPLTRVGIERSGRNGGDALFGSFKVDTTGLNHDF